MLKKLFDYFLFTSVFIAGCAVLMAHQAFMLLHLHYQHIHYLAFVFFATLCSYNFHWYLTPDSPSENARVQWTQQHKKLHLVLYIIGLAGSAFYFFYFIRHWIWLSGAVLLTFLYSAPKLPHPFVLLKRVAIGKTIFLAFVWMYVTTFLPVAFDEQHWGADSWLFIASRFFLIYAICIPFDYRDREYDRQEGIRSMITHFSETNVNRIFYFSLLAFAICTIALCIHNIPLLIVMLLPGIITALLFPVAKRNYSDYLYYFVLDGLMMLSALLTLLLPLS
ncbi:MAG: UbiA family prenyltransferase [Chitinophagaceae bacterium]